MHIKSLSVNIGLLFTTLLLFFGGVELMLRVTGLVKMHDYTPPIYERSENPAISYALKPNMKERAFRSTVTTDEHGFRTHSSELTAHSSSIAILGDSITFGYGVEDHETLPARLQELLPNSTVINAGTPGYHIGQEAALYTEKIKPLDPEILVLVFYWNDFDGKTSWLDEDGVLRAKGWQPTEKICTPIDRGILRFIPGKCWLDLNSAFYKGMKKHVNTRSAISDRNRKRQEENRVVQVDVQLDVQLSSYRTELSRLASMAPEKRLFVIWPDAERHENIRPGLTAIAEAQGFTVLDLYDHFGNQMETLSWDYVHPSKKSLREAAHLLADALP